MSQRTSLSYESVILVFVSADHTTLDLGFKSHHTIYPLEHFCPQGVHKTGHWGAGRKCFCSINELKTKKVVLSSLYHPFSYRFLCMFHNIHNVLVQQYIYINYK